MHLRNKYAVQHDKQKPIVYKDHTSKFVTIEQGVDKHFNADHFSSDDFWSFGALKEWLFKLCALQHENKQQTLLVLKCKDKK